MHTMSLYIGDFNHLYWKDSFINIKYTVGSWVEQAI